MIQTGTMLKHTLKNLSIEEITNTLTHGFGLVLSLFGLVLLVYLAAIHGDFWHILSSVVYGLSLVILYSASTLFHGATSPVLKEKLRLIDHCCIYLLIAGTYTPFTLVALRGTFGTGLFILVWIFAIVGISLKIFFHHKIPAASVISYLVMGWLGIVAVEPLFNKLGLAPLILVIAGGLAYTLGTVFFGWISLKHHHAVWHLFVLVGSFCHFLAISIYVLPYTLNL
jgi:hemolysin III